MEWDLQIPQLKLVTKGTSIELPAARGDSGFFTSVSSRGTSNAIIWVVSHPDDAGTLWLYAFQGTPSGANLAHPLFHAPTGTWPYGGNANVVPTVANGKVYVASYQQLMIFGHHERKGTKIEELHLAATERMRIALSADRHEVFGTILEVKESRFTMRARDGKDIEVNASGALAAGRSIRLIRERNIQVIGTYDPSGVLLAESIQRAKARVTWLSDR